MGQTGSKRSTTSRGHSIWTSTFYMIKENFQEQHFRLQLGVLIIFVLNMFSSRSMFASRRVAQLGQRQAQFHATSRAFVKVGDAVPDLEVLTEGSPGNKVNLAKELDNKHGIIIGVPAAFSMYIPSSSSRELMIQKALPVPRSISQATLSMRSSKTLGPSSSSL